MSTTAISEWMAAHDTLLWSLLVLSAVMFVGTIVAVPWIILRLPADYFARRSRRRRWLATQSPTLGRLLLAIKNLLGLLFLVMGVTMLVLPGQGVLTILIGLTLLDFPGKFKLERFIVRRRPVLQSMNWLRERAERPPLVID